MKGFLVALQFLTRIPIKLKSVEPSELAKSMLWFPVIGFMIGLVLVFSKLIMGRGVLNITFYLAAAFMLIILVKLTGGLHLEGLADTCDGFYGGKNKDEILKIMHRGNIGPMGVIGVTLMLLLKYTLLIALFSTVFPGSRQYVTLLIMPMISRWVLVVISKMVTYVKYEPREGTAEPFVKYIGRKEVLIATLITVFLSILPLVLWGSLGVFSGCLAGFALCVWGLITAFICLIPINKKLGGITGDTLGLINEVVEASLLFFAYMIFR